MALLELKEQLMSSGLAYSVPAPTTESGFVLCGILCFTCITGFHMI